MTQYEGSLDLREFEAKGFTLLRQVVSKQEADRFLKEAVKPALLEQGIDLEDPRSWPAGSSGMRVRAVDGTDHPIQGRDKRWPEFFESEKLRRALDELHGGVEGRKWRWNAGAIDGVGWIHLRLPIKDNWGAPSEGWHLDETTRSLKTEVSVVLLPIVTPLRGDSGGTALLRGSHLEIARAMRTAGSLGAVDWERMQTYIEGYLKPAMLRRDPHAIVEARGEPGDALVLHPLLYHAASDNVIGSPPRVTFNLSVHHAGGLPLPSDPRHPLNPIERTLLAGCCASTESLCSGAQIHYGEPFFLRFSEHRGLLGFPPDRDGNDEIARVTGERNFIPTTQEHTEMCAMCFLPFVSTDSRLGEIVRCGDVVLLRRFFKDVCVHIDPSDVASDVPPVRAAFSHFGPYHEWQRLEIHGISTLPIHHGDTVSLRASAAKVCLTADPHDSNDAPSVFAKLDHPNSPWQQLTILNFLRP